MEKKTKLDILTLLVVGTLILVALNVRKNISDKREIENQKQQRIEKEIKLLDCEKRAYENYRVNWNFACDEYGLANNCSLPLVRKQMLDDYYNQIMDRCVVMYN